MNKIKIAQSLTAIVLGSVLAGAIAMADTSVTQDAKSAANTTGQKIDSSMKSASGYMDDAPLLRKSKARGSAMMPSTATIFPSKPIRASSR